MDTFLYLLARGIVAFLQALPIRVVARIGRCLGGLAYILDGKHRKVAVKNLTMCFGDEKSPAEIKYIARENFRRIGENYLSAIKTAAMSVEQIQPHLTLLRQEHVPKSTPGEEPPSAVMAVGHFGNFELYARLGDFLPDYKVGTTYRGLRQPGLNRLMQSLREKNPCKYFERRSEGAELKAFSAQPGILLGLLTDQRTIQGALKLPFLGHECATNAAPAIFARRYRMLINTCICYRTGLARWQLEFGPQIPTHENGKARSTEDLMRDINRALEVAVRRDPANWFWVHDRWKKYDPEPPPPPRKPAPTSEPK